MGNSLRCCLACVLPCGALDLIRIVHLNGRVEEYGRPVAAGEILAANPNHVLSKPCCSQGGAVAVRRTILIVSPDSELERGEIYFLIPASSVPDKKKKSGGGAAAATPAASGPHGKSKQAAPSSDHGAMAVVTCATCRRRRGRRPFTRGALAPATRRRPGGQTPRAS
ncbi:hypothetical protein OsJ_17250 [Oryza sativa Japonica Group]|uniref:Uncharacterized protein n=1 Tax=Oryza sativa subsp. japonica TaxID=39947 RepID=B9FHQ7_ORYSJ|nr:hypothetical protein OsJ_17250 [Oryza sativa Japonica Group]